jgi:hypothetical protein
MSRTEVILVSDAHDFKSGSSGSDMSDDKEVLLEEGLVYQKEKYGSGTARRNQFSSLRILEDSELEIGKSSDALPLHCRLLDGLFFGAGTYSMSIAATCIAAAWYVYIAANLLWCVRESNNESIDVIGARIRCLPSTSLSLWRAVADLSVAYATMHNSRFGYMLCKQEELRGLIGWCSHFSSQMSHCPMNVTSLNVTLGYCGWASWAFCLLYCAGEVTETDYQWGLALTLVDGFATIMAFGPAIYLCLLWLWSNYVMYLATINLVELMITEGSVDSGSMDARRALMQLVDKMTDVSRQWSGNNAARVVSCMLYATSRSILVMDGRFKDYRNLIFAVLYFGIVWVSAAAPGLVSNKLITYVTVKLSNIPDVQMHRTAQTPEQIGYRLRVQQKAILLMQTADCLQSKVGMHFMGVPMTVQKAVAVGSALAYMISALVQLYSQCS